MAHLADMGGLHGSLTFLPTYYGEASIGISGQLNVSRLTEAKLEIKGILLGSNQDFLVPANTAEAASIGIKGQFNFVQLTQPIATSQTQLDNKDYLRNLSSTFALSQYLKRVTDETVSQPMSLGQDTPQSLLSSIEVAGAIAAFKDTLSISVLELSQLISFNLTLLRPLQTDIVLGNNLSGFKILASGGVIPTPPPAGAPVDQLECDNIVRADDFEIIELVSLDSYTMRHPDIGDSILVNSLTIDESSRGNVDLSFVPDLLNQHIIRRLTFSNIPSAKKNEYQDFLRQHGGLRMSITVPEGGTVNGYITNLDTTFTDESTNNPDPACPDSGAWTFQILFVEEVT